MTARSAWERAFELLLPLHLFTLLSLSVVEQNDFWGHLRYARTTLETHAFPDVDHLSFVTDGQRFVDQQWLSQVTLYEAYVHGGLGLVILIHALAITAGYALVWAFARRRVRIANAAVATIIAAAIGGAHWGVRPQTFSFLLFGILVRILDEHAAGRKKALWFAVPLFAVWANVHGIYTLGWLAVGIHVGVQCIEAVRKDGLKGLRAQGNSIAAAFACVLAGAINPHGVRGLIEHVMQFVDRGHGFVGGEEFDPMSIRRLDGIVFVYAVGRFGYALLNTGWRPPHARSVMLVVFALFAMNVVRVEPWFGMLLLTPLAQALDAEDDARNAAKAPATKPTVVAVVVVLSIAAAIAALPAFRSSLPLPPSRRSLAAIDTPTLAVKSLCESSHDHERVFADQAFAAYIEFACPAVQIFVDTRVTPFDERAWEQYGAVTSGRYDQARILDGWHVEAVMLRTAAQGAGIAALREHGGWQEVHRDPVAVLLVRADQTQPR